MKLKSIIAAILALAVNSDLADARFHTVGTATQQIFYNIVTDAGATCNGVTDTAPNFKTFNTWARANQGSGKQVVLTVPNGSNCFFGTAQSISGAIQTNSWAYGINNLIVEGTGATLSSVGGSGFTLGAVGVCGVGLSSASGCSARIQSASPGATTLTLTSASFSAGYISRFTVGKWIMIGGLDVQGLFIAGFGFPQNNTYFEWRQITAVNTGTGVITLDRPITNSYLSTWPNYNSGSSGQADQGGPATIWTADDSWNATQEYRGLTITQTGQFNGNVRNITYRNVFFTGASGNCGAFPSQNETFTAVGTNWDQCVIEVDKLVGTVTLDTITAKQIDWQSNSIANLVMTNSTITSAMFGAARNSQISDTTFANFRPGSYTYGNSSSLVCTRCTVTSYSAPPQGGNSSNFPPPSYTMSGGVISWPVDMANSAAQNWASPIGGPVFISTSGGGTNNYNMLDVFTVQSISGGVWPAADNQTTTPNVTIASASKSLAVSTSIFASGDVGKTIIVNGAGATSFPLRTHITAFTDAQHVTLYDAASTSLSASAQQVQWGTALVNVQTNQVGGFPDLTSLGNSYIRFDSSQAPIFTCDACLGDPVFTAMNIQNGATPSAPLGSFSKRTFTTQAAAANVGSLAATGKLVSLSINVTAAYTGSGTGILNPTGQFHNFTVKQSSWTQYDWVPVINAKQVGLRVITPAGVTCDGVAAPTGCAGDSNMTVPEAVVVQSSIAPSLILNGTGGVNPTFSITIQTDQTPTTATNLRQENFFGLTGAAWQDPSTYYVPGTGNPAVSTADYYGQQGVAWMRPNDLTATNCGSTGSTIAAAKGRYVWISSSDHQGSNYTFLGDAGFRLGFSNDPGTPPTSIDVFYAASRLATSPQVASITGSISGNTLTVSAVTGIITFDGHATVNGAGVTSALITSQNSGSTPGGIGTYTIAGSPQTVGSEAMTVNQTNYAIYQNPYFVCNPDDATFPFYVYAEGAGSGIQHEEGIIKSADLITWTLAIPSHVTLGFPSWSSFQRPVWDSTNSWHSTGFQFQYPQTGNTFSRAKWTSTDGNTWIPGNSNFNSCLPANGPGFDIGCGAGTHIAVDMEGSPDRVTIGSQDWNLSRFDTQVDNSRAGTQWVGRTAIDANFNVLSSPAQVKIATYAGNYPGPNYLQSVGAYVEDGIAHYYATTGFPTSSSLYALVDAASYLNGGACLATPGGYFSVTGSITSGVMTVTALLVNTVAINAGLVNSSADGIPTGVFVTGQLTGTPGGIGTYSVSNSGFTSHSNITIIAFTCGGLWQQGLDYYTEIIDSTAAAGAAPVGVRASCASSTASLVWYDALPTRTYRLYRGTTAGSQTTLVGDFTGLSATDTGMTLNAVTYYKLVYLSGGVEQKSRVVSTYCSTSAALVNAHFTRVLAAGADPATINHTWLDTFYGWLSSNGLVNDLEFATMVDFGVVQSGSVINKIFDFGTTRLPRGGDYTPLTSNTTYSATGINGFPAWVNGTNTSYGYYGGGRLNNIQRKTQITFFAAYQKPNTAQISPFITGQFSSRILLDHTSGSPGAINFLLADATHLVTATAAVSGLATDFHTMSGTFDGTTLLAYSDGIAGSGQTGLVIPSPNLNPPDLLTGQVGLSAQTGNVRVLASGGDGAVFNVGGGTYTISSNQAAYNGGAQMMFDKSLTGAQETSLNTLIRTHFGF